MSENIFIEGQDYPAQSFESDDEGLLYEDEATMAARKAFGISYLFPWQRLVISNILDSEKAVLENNCEKTIEEIPEGFETTEDIFCKGRQIVLLPTGAGKSLCFLTPALLLKGPTLVLYPLIALMADQQRRMEEGSLHCVVFKGGQTNEEREENFRQLKEGKARVILANPEVLQNEELVQRLKLCKISHIAIDEAHCVSEWGDSFRPAYLTLGKIIKDLEVQIVTAFTATASPPVLNRVREVLFDGRAHLLQSESDRPNIHYEVRYAWAKKKAVLKACVESRKPLIVFCSSRRRTEDMARLLNAYFGQDKARYYHAGMTKEEKLKVEKWFFDSTEGMLAATCAYGMGMDKGNIYTVIHLDAPEHLENFIQEAGRAGRKGDNVKSILIWSHQDDVKYRQAPEGSREKVMGGLAHTKNCRRQFMLNYLSGESPVCSGCDICDARQEGKVLDYEARDAEKVLRFIKKRRLMFTKDELINYMTDRFNREDLEFFGQKVWDAKDIQEILKQLFAAHRIKKAGGLWENHLDVYSNKAIKALTVIPQHRHCIRILHYFRLQFRRFLQKLE